jgi:hypothetical protein
MKMAFQNLGGMGLRSDPAGVSCLSHRHKSSWNFAGLLQLAFGGSRRRLRGDVLMEYVILLVCLIPVLVGATAVFAPDGQPIGAMFNPAGDYKYDFGMVGQAFHSSYTNIVIGVSQPTP